jgi:exportin-2 (importin alpha re-exporter)
MFRSDALYLEMNYVIENFSAHMINALGQCLEMANKPEAQTNEPLIRTLYSVINSILHIIESVLSQEELPDFYEENLPQISQVCIFVLGQDYPKFSKVPDEIVKARGKVVSLIYLYSFKFGEYFKQYNDGMFQAIWQLVERGGVQPTKQSEKLVRITVKYMGEMVSQASKQEFIKMNLIKIFDILILPNISITAEDLEEYEDDADAYIRNDLEESDTETRRRHCMKFVQQLSKRFPMEMGGMVSNYVNNYLADYETNRQS